MSGLLDDITGGSNENAQGDLAAALAAIQGVQTPTAAQLQLTPLAQYTDTGNLTPAQMAAAQAGPSATGELLAVFFRDRAEPQCLVLLLICLSHCLIIARCGEVALESGDVDHARLNEHVGEPLAYGRIRRIRLARDGVCRKTRQATRTRHHNRKGITRIGSELNIVVGIRAISKIVANHRKELRLSRALQSAVDVLQKLAAHWRQRTCIHDLTVHDLRDLNIRHGHEVRYRHIEYVVTGCQSVLI